MRVTNPLAGLPREVGILVVVAAAVAIGYGVVAPAIPLFASSFGVGNTAAGAVVSIFAATRLVSALGGGRVVERIGERTSLALGIALVAVSSGLAGLSQTYVQLLILRGAGGVGSAVFTIAATTLLLRSVPARQRATAQGLFQGGFLIGGIAGPAIGGFIITSSLRAPFFLYAGTLAVAGGIGMAMLPRRALGDGSTATGADGGATTTLREALRLSAYRSALFARFSYGLSSMGVRFAVVPIFVSQGLREDNAWVGVGFTVTALLSAVFLLPAGRIADRRGRRPVIVTGALISAVGMLMLAGLQSLPGYLVAMGVFGIGVGMLGPVTSAVVGDVIEGRAGTVVAAHQMAGDLGSVVGPLLAGLLVDAAGFGWAFSVTAVVLVASAALAARAPETNEVEPAPA
ncbi:MAG: MFS transporter [Mycobacteriaceae bacterium]